MRTSSMLAALGLIFATTVTLSATARADAHRPVVYVDDAGSLEEVAGDRGDVLPVQERAIVVTPAEARSAEEDTFQGSYAFDDALVIEAEAHSGGRVAFVDDHGVVVARSNGDRGDVYVQDESGAITPARAFVVGEDGTFVEAGAPGPRVSWYLSERGGLLVASE